MRNVTLKDIARKLNISEATVSLAINNKSIVNEETRRKVLECARDMNYKPNPLARGLATNKSMTIGFVCPDSENPFIGRILKLMNHYCNQFGYSLVLALSENDVTQESKVLQNFIDKRFDGIIILPLDIPENNSDVFSNIKREKIPLVFCDSYYTGYKDDCIMTDYAKGSYLLTKHLLENHHRNIWYLTTKNQKIPVSKLRIDGYIKAYQEAGLEWKESWVVGCEQATGENAYLLTKKLLAEREKPDAILTINDYMAYGVRKAIKDSGYTIPEDISLAGYDDAFNEILYENPMTTVRQDIDMLAKSCVYLLMEKIGYPLTENGPIVRKIEPQLVIRNTTRKGDSDGKRIFKEL